MRTGVLILLLVMLPAHALAADPDYGSLWRSLLVPGSGQAHQGNYKKAAIFAGATLVSAAGVFVLSIQYKQAADKYNNQKRLYNSYGMDLEQGKVVNIDDINITYREMNSAFDDAESLLAWRTGFAVALVATYGLNIFDILTSKPHDPETALAPPPMNYGVDYTKERVLLVRSWRF